MSAIPFWLYVLVMAGVTYCVRMVPMVLLRRKIHSRFIKSFLYYVPYAVLGAMTLPSIFYSTASVPSAVIGFITAACLSWKGKSLIVVALAACAAAYLAELLLSVLA